MSDPKTESDSLNDRVLATLGDIADTTNPFKLFFKIGTAMRDVSSAIEDSSVTITDRLVTGKNAGVKEAILYGLICGKDTITATLEADAILKKESEWKKLKLEKWILSAYPNYRNLPLPDKQAAVLAYYGTNDKPTKIRNLLLLEWWTFDLIPAEKSKIADSSVLKSEKAIRDILNFGNFLRHDRKLATEKDALKYEYYGLLGIAENETRDVAYFLQNSPDTIRAYIAEVTEKIIRDEIATIRKRFDSKFQEAERNSEYYEKLSLLKTIIVRFSESPLSPVFLPFVIRKVARNLEKNSVSGLKVPEFVLGNHFAKNYEEYYRIKKFFTSLKREIRKPSGVGGSVILTFVILAVFFPVFFLLAFMALLVTRTITRMHDYRKLALKYDFGFLAIPLALAFSVGTVFFFSYTHGDFYKILYERFKNPINYVFLTSGWDSMSHLKWSLMEWASTGTGETSTGTWTTSANMWAVLTGTGKTWTGTYEECREFDYVSKKKSCVEK